MSWASSMVATLARWRVGSNSSSKFELDKDDCESAGEIGNTGGSGTKTGNVGGEEGLEGGAGMLSGSPEACSACTTALQPLSRVFILSLSS
jgi:hypothetical protein